MKSIRQRLFRQFSNDERNQLAIFAFLLNALLIAVACWELIPVENGLAYDSSTYAFIAKKFPHYLYWSKVDRYYIQRILPSSLVGAFGFISRSGFSSSFLVLAFRALDLIAINVALFQLARSLKLVHVTGRHLTFGLVLCFSNFFILKYTLYLPALTDATAFAIGACLLHAYLAGSNRWMLLLGLLGAFTHPLLLYVSLGLFMYPNVKRHDHSTNHKPRVLSLAPYVAAATYLISCILIYNLYYGKVSTRQTSGTTVVNMKLYFASVLAAACFVYFIAKMIVASRLLDRVIKEFSRARLGIAFLVLASIKILQYWRSSGAGPLSIKDFALNIFTSSITFPGVFLVAHTAFFGIVVLLILICFRRFKMNLLGLGTGYVGFVIAFLALGLCSESRQLGICLPFVIVPLAISSQQLRMRWTHIAALTFLALLCSKLWLPLNSAEFVMTPSGNIISQRLFMNIGPWMSQSSYVIQLLAFVAVAIAIGLVVRHSAMSARDSGQLQSVL